MFSARHYVQALLYERRPRFTTMAAFLNRLEPQVSTLPYSADGAARAIDGAKTALSSLLGRKNRDAAFAALAMEDLQFAQSRLNAEACPVDLGEHADVTARLEEATDLFTSVLRDRGIPISRPRIHVVDEFPSPYKNGAASAMNIDAADAVSCGVAEGLYFRSKMLRPLYSVFLLAHEMIHVVFGQSEPLSYARGIEEGFAELVGCFVLAPLIFGVELAHNLTLFNRIYPTTGEALDRYLPYLRQAQCLYEDLGDDGVFEVLRKGRTHLKLLELEIVSGRSVRGDGRPVFSDSVRTGLRLVCQSTSPLFICSPEARLVFGHLRPGILVRELCALVPLGVETLRAALGELSTTFGYLSLTSDGTCVQFSDNALAVIPHSLLYSVEAA